MMGHLLDEIRNVIRTSGKTRYRLWKETGISQAQLCKLIQGERGLSIEALERLADALGVEIVVRRKRGQKGR